MRSTVAATAVVLATFASACRTPNSQQAGLRAAGDGIAAGISRPCVHESPIAGDGYTSFLPASADKVSRRVVTATGLAPDPVKTVKPTQAQLDETMRRISRYIDRINELAPVGSQQRRSEIYRSSGGTPEPYCLFHPAGREIYGTVILFHGFNDRPQQQAALGSYLFHNGFNVYNSFLVDHWRVPGTEYWPKTVYKPDILALAAQKAANPANQAKIAIIKPKLEIGQLGPEEMQAINEVLGPELSTDLILQAWKDPGGPEFQKIFNFGAEGTPPDFLTFIRDAESRLADLDEMPGAVFVSGLSVGGAIALGLAEQDGGKRIRGVVAQSAWLKSVSNQTQLQVMVAGPLDDKVKSFGGQFPISWENHQVEFSPASIAATAALGSWVGKPERVKRLAVVPTAFFTTDAEVSADNAAQRALFEAISAGPLAGFHQWAQYPKESHNVGHAITDPENYRGDDANPASGNAWNRYWRTLYQEIFRFYTTGQVSKSNFLSKNQDGALPDVKCAITGEYAYRCGL